MAERTQAIPFGGLGAMRQVMRNLKPDRVISLSVKLLKIHNPCHESDHVLNLAYNALCGGACIEDLELRRQSLEYYELAGRPPRPRPALNDRACARGFCRG